MKPEATQSKERGEVAGAKTYRSHSYQKVLDGRKQPIRGLWKRGDNFLARLTVEDDQGRKQIRWKLLEGAQTIPQAQTALAKLKGQRDANTLPVLKRTPKLTDCVADYFRHFEMMKDAKRPATLCKERGAMKRWTAHMGETRVDRITRAQINAHMAARQSQGISGRTVNLDVIALRNVLNKAMDDGWVKTLPTENIRPLKWTAKKRGLVTAADIASLCEAAPKVSKNGVQLADYLWLLAYTGAREKETLRLKWADVDFVGQQITIGADGLAKNHGHRVVDFYPKLEAHLLEMFARRAPDSQFVFPSPQRGADDRHGKTLRESLRLARQACGLPRFGFHDCRHFFVSYCVMSGIDYMTIARWVGHADGGVLIGKVYGHLANEHAQRQAQRITFEPQIVSAAVA